MLQKWFVGYRAYFKSYFKVRDNKNVCKYIPGAAVCLYEGLIHEWPTLFLLHCTCYLFIVISAVDNSYKSEEPTVILRIVTPVFSIACSRPRQSRPSRGLSPSVAVDSTTTIALSCGRIGPNFHDRPAILPSTRITRQQYLSVEALSYLLKVPSTFIIHHTISN